MPIISSETWKCDICCTKEVSGVIAPAQPKGWVKTGLDQKNGQAWEAVVACPNCAIDAVETAYKSKHNNPIGM